MELWSIWARDGTDWESIMNWVVWWKIYWRLTVMASGRISLTEMAHVIHMWSSKNTCGFSHVKNMCIGEVVHMWNFTWDFSHVKFYMWRVTCDISHVNSLIWISCAILYVYHLMWKMTCDIHHVNFQKRNFLWLDFPYVKFHIWLLFNALYI